MCCSSGQVSAILRNIVSNLQEMHHLVTALSQKTFSDPCDWIDLRHVKSYTSSCFLFFLLFCQKLKPLPISNSLQIPEEDIIWQNGHPGIPTRKCFLKPGETILYTTSTAQQKKRITEVSCTQLQQIFLCS